MAEVFITGASGFVGRHLEKADVPDYLNVIFNLASISSVEESILYPKFVFKNNIDCMLQALEEARQTDKTLVHLSTVEASRPSNPYAASKAAQEALALAYHNTYGVKVVIARSHNIIGEGQSEEKFIPKLVRQIKAGETVDIYDSGSRVYNPIGNVISALEWLALIGKPGKIYLIRGGKAVTNLQMAEKVAKLLGKPLQYRVVKGRAGYKPTIRGEGEKIPNWKPPQTLEEGLAWISQS